MTSRLSTKLFAVARIVGRRAMAALSKNGKEVIFNRLIYVIKSLGATPVEWSRVWVIKTRGNGVLSRAFTWRRYRYQEAFNAERETKREPVLPQGDFDRRVIAVK